MTTQIIERKGKKEYAVIPYKDFLKMQEELEDYRDLVELRKARNDPSNQKTRPYLEVAKELGWTK
jgi:PHD/YefM family antitoxin component YafN of YafNO toxin-antitoxin module